VTDDEIVSQEAYELATGKRSRRAPREIGNISLQRIVVYGSSAHRCAFNSARSTCGSISAVRRRSTWTYALAYQAAGSACPLQQEVSPAKSIVEQLTRRIYNHRRFRGKGRGAKLSPLAPRNYLGSSSCRSSVMISCSWMSTSRVAVS
jgi:hypothetical protein